MGAENVAKTVIHMHGALVPEMFDGYPEATFLPGNEATYLYLNEQQAGSIWYHDHALGITRLNVYMGLAGLYLLRDAVEDALNVPRGEFEVPLVLQDKRFNPDGSLNYAPTSMDNFFGDKILVNGKVWPYFDVKRGKYRFRIYNGSGSRSYRLALVPPSGLMTFTVIGNEGGLLEAPVPGVGQVLIGPGERFDVVIDFQPYAAGTEILLQNTAPAPFPNGTLDVPQVMKFRVVAQTGDTDPLPAALRPITRLQPSQAVVTRDLVLKSSGDACGKTKWLINNLGWATITEYPQLDTIEIWRFINDSGVSHPMHLHLVHFQILDRDGFTKGPGGEIIPNGNPQAAPAEESGWRDTAMVGPNEILRVIAKFERYKGRFAYHCHILDHEDHEMMRQFQTIKCGDADLDPTEACDDGAANGTPASCCSSSCTLVAAGTACEDGDPCTVGDSCQGSTCVAGSPLGAPGEVSNVQLGADRSTLTWDPITGAAVGTVYDAARGTTSQLPVGGGADETCVGPGLSAATVSDPTSPVVGQAFWYLVRGRHVCGTGSYGYTVVQGAPLTERITVACP
jgi:spore coat protein A